MSHLFPTLPRLTLRIKCTYSELFRSLFFHIRTKYGEIYLTLTLFCCLFCFYLFYLQPMHHEFNKTFGEVELNWCNLSILKTKIYVVVMRSSSANSKDSFSSSHIKNEWFPLPKYACKWLGPLDHLSHFQDQSDLRAFPIISFECHKLFL